MFTNLNLTDMETCYKVFRRGASSPTISSSPNRFGFEPEITAKVAKRQCRIYEVPISYSGRDYAEGKKIGWKDGVAAHLAHPQVRPVQISRRRLILALLPPSEKGRILSAARERNGGRGLKNALSGGIAHKRTSGRGVPFCGGNLRGPKVTGGDPEVL